MTTPIYSSVPVHALTDTLGNVIGLKEFSQENPIPIGYGGTGVSDIESLKAILGISSVSASIEDIVTTPSSVSLSNLGHRIVGMSAVDLVITVPDLSADIAVGTWFEVTQGGIGSVILEPGAGVTLLSVNDFTRLAGKNASVRLVYVGNNTWRLNGELVAGKAYSSAWNLFGDLVALPSSAINLPGDYCNIQRGSEYNPVRNKGNGTLTITDTGNYGTGFIVKTWDSLSDGTKACGIEVTGRCLVGGYGSTKNIAVGFSTMLNSNNPDGKIITFRGDGNVHFYTSGAVASDALSGTLLTGFDLALNETVTIRLERSPTGVYTSWINGVKQRRTISNVAGAVFYPAVTVAAGSFEITDLRVMKG